MAGVEIPNDLSNEYVRETNRQASHKHAPIRVHPRHCRLEMRGYAHAPRIARCRIAGLPRTRERACATYFNVNVVRVPTSME